MIKAVKTPVVQTREVSLHGHKVSYRIAGRGPAIMLVHGIAGNGATWTDVMERLAGKYTLIAPDLPGHGVSDKPVGDYSLGSLASMLRDLMVTIGHERATIVGHSLGGGVAMQFVYQFPQRCDRLVLVSSGGLGREVNLMLRAACLPGADLVLSATAGPVAAVGNVIGSVLGRLGWRPGADLEEVCRGFASLADNETRSAFLHTLKSVVGIDGQRVNASDKLYLVSEMPSLLISGGRDSIIPASHAAEAHKVMPDSRLVIFPKAGHMPHVDEPAAFADALNELMESTKPANITTERWSEVLRGVKPARKLAVA
jgi:pimeloyl-ACP methyl ester carboxylesterase